MEFVDAASEWLREATDAADAWDRLVRSLVHQFSRDRPGANEGAGAAPAFFQDYSFSLDETATDRVTPEVLGLLCESSATDRESQGIFYTPRGVADLMAAESLRHWLACATGIDDDCLSPLTYECDASHLSSDQRDQIRDRLLDLAVLDPACGSGALLVSFLHRWCNVVGCLGNIDIDTALARFVGESIFGVDLDERALDVCRARVRLAALHQATSGQASFAADGLRVGNAIAWRPTTAGGQQQWQEWFPGAMKRGGFDIVLANPPYVRVERLANRDQLRDYADVGRYRADLYHYFFVLAAELLACGGVATLITSNSWLDSKSGAHLQQFLLDHTRVRAVLESTTRRAFVNADINAAVTVIGQGSQHATKAGITGCDEHRITRGTPINTEFRALSGDWSVHAIGKAARREVAQETLRRSLSGGKSIRSGKWGGRFLRAPAIYDTIVDGHPRLVELRDCCVVKGYIHDNDTGPAFPPTRFVKSVRSVNCIELLADDTAVIEFGVKAAETTRQVAPILVARTYGSRHLVVWNVAGALGKEFYKVMPAGDVDPRVICGQLNSTWGILQREILGLTNLGEGGLKLSRDDVGRFLVLPDLGKSTGEFVAAFERMAGRPQLEIGEEFQQQDRREMDGFLLTALDVPAALWPEFFEAAESLVTRRRDRGRA